MSDMVNNPSHYSSPSGVECLELAEWMPFTTGNALKYLWRQGRKGAALQDLDKACVYIERAMGNPRTLIQMDRSDVPAEVWDRYYRWSDWAHPGPVTEAMRCLWFSLFSSSPVSHELSEALHHVIDAMVPLQHKQILQNKVTRLEEELSLVEQERDNALYRLEHPEVAA